MECQTITQKSCSLFEFQKSYDPTKTTKNISHLYTNSLQVLKCCKREFGLINFDLFDSRLSWKQGLSITTFYGYEWKVILVKHLNRYQILILFTRILKNISIWLIKITEVFEFQTLFHQKSIWLEMRNGSFMTNLNLKKQCLSSNQTPLAILTLYKNTGFVGWNIQGIINFEVLELECRELGCKKMMH